MEFKPKKKHGVNKSRDTFENTNKNWLFEDKEWSELRSSVQSEPKNRSRKRRRPFVKHTSAFDEPLEDEVRRKTELNIKLTLPKIDSSRFRLISKTANKLKSLSRKQVALALACLLVVVAGVVVGNKYIFGENYNDASVAGSSDSTARKPSDPLPRENPQFQLLYPGSKDKDTVGGIVRVSPEENESVYAYTDTIGETPIQVSQQKIPKNFEGKADTELEKVAKDFQATQAFTVDSVRVYHGKSNSGVQSLIFIKGNLLVFIKSSSELSEEVWVAYISSLHS